MALGPGYIPRYCKMELESYSWSFMSFTHSVLFLAHSKYLSSNLVHSSTYPIWKLKTLVCASPREVFLFDRTIFWRSEHSINSMNKKPSDIDMLEIEFESPNVVIIFSLHVSLISIDSSLLWFSSVQNQIDQAIYKVGLQRPVWVVSLNEVWNVVAGTPI